MENIDLYHNLGYGQHEQSTTPRPNGNRIKKIYVMCFYKISLMCPDMDLELSIHKETAYSDGSFLTEIIHVYIFLFFKNF